MHVLYGNQLAEAEDDRAAEANLAGTNMPKSYGEAKTFFNQEEHLHYYLGLLKQRQQRLSDAQAAFEEAAIYKATVSEISLFRALALKKSGKERDAVAVLQEMLTVAEDKIINKDLRGYYGVGSPTPMTFENDIPVVIRYLCSGGRIWQRAYS